MGWNGCVSHRKTRKLRCIRRKQGREGTSHWLSSSRIAWTRTVLPVRTTEDENESARTRAGDGWVEAGRSWSSRNIGERITAAVAGVTSLMWGFTCAIIFRNGSDMASADWTSPLSLVHNLLHLSGVQENRREGTFSVQQGSWSLI